MIIAFITINYFNVDSSNRESLTIFKELISNSFHIHFLEV